MKEAKKRQGTRTDIPELIPEGFKKSDARDVLGRKLNCSGGPY